MKSRTRRLRRLRRRERYFLTNGWVVEYSPLSFHVTLRYGRATRVFSAKQLFEAGWPIWSPHMELKKWRAEWEKR